MWSKQRIWLGLLIAVLTGSLFPMPAAAAKPFTLEQILGPAFPYELSPPGKRTASLGLLTNAAYAMSTPPRGRTSSRCG